MKPFMNKGWEHYEKMQGILFSTATHGVTTYEQKEDKLPVLVFGTEQVDL